jgi:hypothetical protein
MYIRIAIKDLAKKAQIRKENLLEKMGDSNN